MLKVKVILESFKLDFMWSSFNGVKVASRKAIVPLR